MPKLVALYGTMPIDPARLVTAPVKPVTEQERAVNRAGAGIALGAIVAILVTVGVFLMAPMVMRSAIVAAYLGMDQPVGTTTLTVPVPP